MVAAPPTDASFDGTSSGNSQEDLERHGGLVGLVSPKTVITSGDSKTSVEVVDDSPEGGLPTERGPESGDEAGDGDADDESDL